MKNKKIITMNNKMAINTYLSTIESEKQISKQEQGQKHRNGDHMEGYQQGEGRGRIGQKVQRIRSINVRYKMDGEVMNSTGSGKTKELVVC